MMSVVRFAILFLIIYKNVESELQSLRSIRNFVVQLRNDSDSMTEYVAKIQAIFCPEQPFCGELTSHSKQNLIRSLPETVTVENETVMTNELRSYVGLCCYPCSCEDTCKYDNNCCLTKAVENKTFNEKLTSSINSECIASTSTSYKNKRGIRDFSRYFMTTQCFSDTNSSVQSKCETPNPYDVTETIPVTSLRSGRTYWNQHCAVCNNDSETIVFWNMRVIFLTHFVFYKSASGTFVFPDTMEEFYNQLLQYEYIQYIPPFEMQQKRCAPQYLQRTCRKSGNDTREADHQFLYESCKLFTSPITFKQMHSDISKNIFCLFCNEESVTTFKHECSFSDDMDKNSNTAMTALINYKDETESSIETESSTYVNSHENRNCSCKEIYDTYQEKCRPVYCPPGSLFIGCSCTEIMATVSGMHVLLKLKVTAEPGSLYPSTDELADFRKALRKAMDKSIRHVNVTILASFRPRNWTNSCYLYLASVSSDGGYDTKETLKPLLDYLYTDVFLKVTINGNKYLVGLVREISLKRINYRFVSAFDPKNQLEFDLEFSVEDRVFKRGLYQEMSPLLFCKQVQLDENEFTKRDGQIIINATSAVVSVSDFYLTAELQARLCVDEYLSSPSLSFGNTLSNDPVTISQMVLCFCIHLALWKTKN